MRKCFHLPTSFGRSFGRSSGIYTKEALGFFVCLFVLGLFFVVVVVVVFVVFVFVCCCCCCFCFVFWGGWGFFRSPLNMGAGSDQRLRCHPLTVSVGTTGATQPKNYDKQKWVRGGGRIALL